MKKLIYIAASFMAILTTSCDPMEDVYDELDAMSPDNYKTDMTLTLSPADYEEVEDAANVPAYVWEDNYFASEQQAATVIPMILEAKYPQLGNGTTAAVTYQKLQFNYSDKGASARTSLVLTEKDDYALGGARYANFDSWEQVSTFLKAKFPADSVAKPEGRLVTLTYDWYNSSIPNPRTNTRTRDYYFVNGQWEQTYKVTENDYAAFERNRYNNFTAADEKQLPAIFNKLLKENVLAEAGNVHYVSYAYYNGSKTQQEVMPLVYDGNNWSQVMANITNQATLQFAKKNGIWVPDVTIKYSLVGADYAWIADPANGLGTESARTNLSNYGNFSTYSWTQEQIVAAIAALIKHKYPNMDEGQKFIVSYDTYPGGVKELALILRASGSYTQAQPGE